MMPGIRSRLGLAPVLVFAAMVGAIISSLGAPLIPTIAASTHSSLSTAQWSLTVTLLVGAVSAPVLGRLGDGPRRRSSLIGALLVVVVGCALAAVTHSLAVLIVGRALQGVGMGLLPLTMAVAREHLPAPKVGPTIALLSVITAAGIGVGYPLSGLIADEFGLAAGFWFGAIIAAAGLVCVAAVVPSSEDVEGPRPDFLGAALLTGFLTALLIAIAQGVSWGWTSTATLGLFAAAVILLAMWIRAQLSAAHPLVQLRLLLHPAVLTCDVCATVMGVAMYANLPTITEFVQAPHSAGYGFGQSVIVAGLCLLPLSVTSFAASRYLPQLIDAVGGWTLLPVGCLLVAVADLFLALLHNSLWEAFVTMAFIGAGIGLTSAVIPSLIVQAVPASETGSALGFFQVVRYIGFSVGSAMAAAILASHTPAHRAIPDAGGYTMVLWIAAAVCVAAALLTWRLSRRARRPVPVVAEELVVAR